MVPLSVNRKSGFWFRVCHNNPGRKYSFASPGGRFTPRLPPLPHLIADVGLQLEGILFYVQNVYLIKILIFGHVARMDCHRYRRILLNGYVHGARARGRPRKKWTDNIKEDCNFLQLSLMDANRLGEDTTWWRTLMRNTHLELPERGSSSSSSLVVV